MGKTGAEVTWSVRTHAGAWNANTRNVTGTHGPG